MAIKNSAIIYAGYDYQTLQGVRLLADWLNIPTKYNELHSRLMRKRLMLRKVLMTLSANVRMVKLIFGRLSLHQIQTKKTISYHGNGY